ncbi:hypothetical protein HWB76_gp193 [Streptomyces phage Blueeyedbeauty]|uniref:Uncharacterized protein n=1 Tax=Streptomyces phage Blueeyedbeauty TaxID=2250336 RepID=A0A345L1Q7_9CAUD|nr:hypothetical protein HWB76_gp193 [Streptomyces phage Blueeyedbeauty]AXH49209.1 hypothetical protein SEA_BLUEEYEDBEAUTY_66 [Streptomyces phage Blueeyedbeauty]
MFSEIVENVSLFLGGMLLGVALGIIATLIGVSAYMNKENDERSRRD